MWENYWKILEKCWKMLENVMKYWVGKVWQNVGGFSYPKMYAHSRRKLWNLMKVNAVSRDELVRDAGQWAQLLPRLSGIAPIESRP